MLLARQESDRMLVYVVSKKNEILNKGKSLLCDGCLEATLEIDFYKQCLAFEISHHGSTMCEFCIIKDHIHNCPTEVLA